MSKSGKNKKNGQSFVRINQNVVNFHGTGRGYRFILFIFIYLSMFILWGGGLISALGP